ncbi:hypothetical protein K438DRAFT_1789491 [Mycena galopus ATCC 62051]|nr:hypothetical protein K438DRAFT_1789491 [Mycena galopus ATCC 62051]
MPAAIRRSQRTNDLLKSYIRHNKGRERRAFLRRRAAHRARRNDPTLRRQAHPILSTPLDSSSDSDTSSDTDTSSTSDSSDSSASDSESEWSDILGPNWRFMGAIADEDYTITELDDSTTSSSSEDMPALFSVSSDSSDAESERSWSSGDQGDDEDSESEDVTGIHRPPLLRRWIRAEIADMSAGTLFLAVLHIYITSSQR